MPAYKGRCAENSISKNFKKKQAMPYKTASTPLFWQVSRMFKEGQARLQSTLTCGFSVAG